MAKLTKAELEEMKAIGYIEGNTATIPDALKVGRELHDKVVEHDAEISAKLAKKQAKDE